MAVSEAVSEGLYQRQHQRLYQTEAVSEAVSGGLYQWQYQRLYQWGWGRGGALGHGLLWLKCYIFSYVICCATMW